MTSGSRGNQSFITPFGGRAVQLLNVYSSVIPAGTVVDLSPGCDEAFTLAAAGSSTLIGVTFEDVAAGEYGWVITGGRAQVLLQTSTGCTRTQMLTLSASEPGKVVAAGGGVFVGKSSETVAALPGVSRLVEAVVSTVGTINPVSIGPGSTGVYRTLFVASGAPAGGDGSAASPFNAIQSAVLAAGALTPAPSATAPVLISIGPGTYDENVLIQTDFLVLQGAGYNDTIISPTTGVGICVSNATAASIDAFHTAGGGSANYALLAAQAPAVAGVTSLQLLDLTISCVGGAGNVPLELLGVPGDDTPTTTAFMSVAFYIWNSTCTLQFGAVAPYMYVRNCNSLLIYWSGAGGAGFAGGTIFYNCAYAYAESTSLAGLDVRYIAADPQGEPAWGMISFDLTNGYLADQVFRGSQAASYVNCSADDTVLNDTASLTAWDSGMGNLDVNDTASVTTYGGFIEGTVDLEAGAIGAFYGTPMRQTLTIAAGAGTVGEVDCSVAGLITDAANKLAHGGEDRYGYYDESGGGGTRAIAFTPNFPNGATINVQITFESLGGAYQTGMVANGTLAQTGFSLTTGGNGRFHWHAHKTK